MWRGVGRGRGLVLEEYGTSNSAGGLLLCLEQPKEEPVGSLRIGLIGDVDCDGRDAVCCKDTSGYGISILWPLSQHSARSAAA